MVKKKEHIHFIGIGGIGMSGIAEVLLNLGYKISGSDLKDSEMLERLKKLGAKVFIGHSSDNISGADVVVFSQAVAKDNPELEFAKKQKIPIIPRAEMLAELMRLKYGIAVGGTHGKTSTTSMVAMVLREAKLDPTIVIGGKLNVLGSNAKLGKGKFLVAEADESDGSFLHLSPTIVVVTNIDNDHLDYYKTMKNVKTSFTNFINKVPFYGRAIVCIDDFNINEVLKSVTKKYISYGISMVADIKAKNIKLNAFGSVFQVEAYGKEMGILKLSVPGIHNIQNALAAFSVGLELNIKFCDIANGLKKFTGVHRRFELLGKPKDILVIDDYAHNPTELKATLDAVKNLGRKKIIAIFQPHRYTRTQFLYNEFHKAFKDIQYVLITDIYSAGETPIPGITAELIVKNLKKHGNKNVYCVKTKEEAFETAKKIAKKGDVIITLGAGDIRKVAQNLYDNYKR